MREGVLCSGGADLPPVTTEQCTPYQDSLVDSIKRYKVCCICISTHDINGFSIGYNFFGEKIPGGINTEYYWASDNAEKCLFRVRQRIVLPTLKLL